MNIENKTQVELTGWEHVVLGSLACSGATADIGMTVEQICAATYIKQKRIEECLRQLKAKQQVKIDEQGRWRVVK